MFLQENGFIWKELQLGMYGLMANHTEVQTNKGKGTL